MLKPSTSSKKYDPFEHLKKDRKSPEKLRSAKRPFNAKAEIKALYDEFQAKRMKLPPSPSKEPEEIFEKRDERKIAREQARLSKLGIDKETYEKLLPESISELEKKRRMRPQPKDFADVVYEEFSSMWQAESQLNHTTFNDGNKQIDENTSKRKKFEKVNKVDKSKKREVIMLKSMSVKEANAALAKWSEENEG
ncbi:hypothetical protein PVAND_011665 [Polypedilum vanderplanki]|uniref:Uncharacterized protein n=1 Tax=Polypedilum vanderplanki TaxID=319348 RepID=A0A9J6CJB1_POLVA|nr:hypothetical protein PVAND_011665 [Polypedilum vanderplanki]